jgi:hypothetical protein
MLLAFVDESARHPRGDHCVYALAAVMVATDDVPGCRTTMEGLRYGKSTVVHWQTERPERRTMIAAALADAPIEGMVAVSMYTEASQSERARRLCLSRLLPSWLNRLVRECVAV